MTGMRSWISATSSFESVVMMANVRIHSLEAGSFQFSQMPAMPNGAPSFLAQLRRGGWGSAVIDAGRLPGLAQGSGARREGGGGWTPGGRTRENRKFIQAPSPEI